MIWNIKVWQTCKEIKNQEGGQHFFTPLYRGGWIYSRTLNYLFKASFFSDSYLQHYHNTLYINLLEENW